MCFRHMVLGSSILIDSLWKKDTVIDESRGYYDSTNT